MIFLRRIAPTSRYILLFSGTAFILWSSITAVIPKSSLLPALRMDFGQTPPTMDQGLTPTNNASYASVSAPNFTRNRSFPEDPSAGQVGIGIPEAQFYVISLPERRDRREKMDVLRSSRGLTWTFVDAIPRNATLVHRILDWVAFQRAPHARTTNAPSVTFRWPEEINALSDSKESLQPSGADSDAWAETSPPKQPKANKFGSPASSQETYPNLPCAIEDDTIPTLNNLNNNPPEWTILTPAKIACWHSHVSAVRQFVDGNLSDVAVILEDDIDMEKDISSRLSNVWTSLPSGWDIVFLGHCWSNESTYPPLTVFTDTSLHPSFSPKCTHAYVLSLSGARRLLQHLRFPPFAYSRALDQAYAWLVRSGRLRSYSIVPSVVVQRKSDKSDISPGSGSEWRESLRDGIFGA